MAASEPALAPHVSLVDAVDHLLNRGAVLMGDATLSVAGIDLVYVGLNLLVASVETMREHASWPAQRARMTPDTAGTISLEEAHEAMPLHPEPAERGLPDWVRERGAVPVAAPEAVELVADPGNPPGAATDEHPERGLARLVLALVELLRQLVERQALRRMEGDGLSEAEIERMGRSLMELAEKMAELRDAFGLEEQDLAIDLGPIGRLI